MSKRTNVVTLRLTDRELDYVKGCIDDFYYFSVSDVLRSFVVSAMEKDERLVVHGVNDLIDKEG